MKKFEAWPELMNDYLKRVFKEPLLWGTHDCCLMPANCVLAMTGEDFAADFRGKYDDGPSAYLALQKFGGGGILETMEILAKRHEWTEVPVLRAQRSDIVMLPPSLCGGDERFGGALGMCVGTISLFISENGMKATSTIPNPGAQGIVHAWRIKSGRD